MECVGTEVGGEWRLVCLTKHKDGFWKHCGKTVSNYVTETVDLLVTNVLCATEIKK
jgi:hypothetical protein